MANVGTIYENSSTWQRDRWLELMDLFIQQKIKKDSLELGLDLGCGTGQRTIDFINKVPSVKNIYAIDANPDMINTAKKNNSSDKIQYELLKIEDVDKTKASGIDFILANYSIHWVMNKELVFKKLDKIIKPGCKLLVGTVEALPDMLQAIDDYLRSHLNIRSDYPYYFMTRSAWKNILTKFGWKILDEIKKEDDHIVDAKISSLRGWYSASAGIAFYNEGIDFFENPEIQALKSFLDENYGIDNKTKWKYREQTYLFVASKE